MPRRLSVFAVAALVLALSSCAGGTTPRERTAPSVGPSTTTPDPLRPQRYVALGDSTVAGPVLRPQRGQQPPGCAQSRVNFASLLARSLDVVAFVDASCSGARTTDLVVSSGEVPAQVRAVTAATDLITLGPIGANDLGLVGTLSRCIFGSCARELTALDRRVASIGPRMRRALASLHHRAPNAEVLVVGYGRYLPSRACPSVEPVSPADGDHAERLLAAIDRVLAGEARRSGARYVDLSAMPGSTRHTSCAPASQRWYAGISPADPDGALPFHPTKLGMASIAAYLEKILRGPAG